MDIVTCKIFGELVFLELLSSEERQQINVWNKDPEVFQYTEPWDFKETEPKSINFGIHDKDSSKLIGDIGINSIDLKNQHAEIGMTIGDKNYWGKGYGTDTVRVILNYCFNKLKLNKVYLDVWEENKRAIGCYLKCGFKKDGVLREHVFRDGMYHNKWIMSVLTPPPSPTSHFLF